MEQTLQKHKRHSGYFLSFEEEMQELVQRIISDSHPDFSEYFGHPVKQFETVVVSDIHLGSKVTRAEEFLLLLQTVRFKRLIINGDIFDSMNLKRLNHHHWKILGLLRSLTERNHQAEVIWIRGNHDGYTDLLSQLLGIQFYDEYIFEWNGSRVLVFHGDIFDKFITRYPLIADVADMIYRSILYLSPSSKKLGRWLKRNSKTFIRNTEKVRQGAVTLAKFRHTNTVICGHTHHVEDTVSDGIHYLNPGSWTDSPTHFVGFTKNQVQVVPFF